jgi:hypothetical protein
MILRFKGKKRNWPLRFSFCGAKNKSIPHYLIYTAAVVS